MFDVEKEARKFKKSRGRSLAKSTQEVRDNIIKNFDIFCKTKYGEGFDELIKKLQKIEDMEAGIGRYKASRNLKSHDTCKSKTTNPMTLKESTSRLSN